MNELDKIVRLQITEAIENIKCMDSLESLEDRNELEVTAACAGSFQPDNWKNFIESLNPYDPNYDRLMNNKCNGHRNFSTLHGSG